MKHLKLTQDELGSIFKTEHFLRVHEPDTKLAIDKKSLKRLKLQILTHFINRCDVKKNPS